MVHARAATAGGQVVDPAWIWHAVAKHVGQPVASGGHHTPRTETSHGAPAVRNTTSHAKHDIEFNAVTLFHGGFVATRCADPGTSGVGHVVHNHGSWVTFSTFKASGLAQCGAGSSGSAIVKAALSHCKAAAKSATSPR